MAKEFSTIAAELEQALVNVGDAKQKKSFADNAALDAQNVYGAAVKAAQVARAAYDEHINEAMTGFAQVHQ